MRVLIVGGSVAGLAAALFLARRGHAVTVLERDAAPLPATPVEAFEKWERRGAPQVRHSHAFLARLRNLLRDRAPDLLDALLAAGAEELRFGELMPATMEDRAARAGDEDLVMLACRRLTFEWVLRRLVCREPHVDFREGVDVRGLALRREPGRPPRVCGVRVAAGEVLPADLVIDASGRHSRLGAWLEAAGARAPQQERSPCEIFYCSRFYRLRPGVAPPQRDTTIGADLGYMKYAIFHGDSGIFSITFAASPEDAPLRRLLRPAPFAAAVRALPATRPWCEPGRAEPVSRVYGMANLFNTWRSLLDGDGPSVLGVLALGDAAVHTNPLYGRGCTLAFVHAERLAEAIELHGDELDALALGFEAATQDALGPWYRIAVVQDAEAARVAEAARNGGNATAGAGGRAPVSAEAGDGRVDPRAWLRSLVRDGLLPALGRDASVARAFFRSFNLLDGPGDWMQDPDVLQRVLAFQRAGSGREPRALGPGREEMLATLVAS